MFCFHEPYPVLGEPITTDLLRFYGAGVEVATKMDFYAPSAVAEAKSTQRRPGGELAASKFVAMGFLPVVDINFESGTCSREAGSLLLDHDVHPVRRFRQLSLHCC